MIVITDLGLRYGDRSLFEEVSITLGEKDRIGLVGRNGAGKSTFLKLIAGEMSPDSGRISIPPRARVGYLHQDMTVPQDKTVIQESLSAFAHLKKLEHDIDKYQEEVTTRTDYESDGYMKLLENLAEATDRFQYLGGNTMQVDAERVLSGLGFKPTDMDRSVAEFSGGWQMRIELAKLLLQKPDYLLLDEPTNHLDIESILWLEEFLQSYEGSVIVISHDRSFLDAVTKRTIEIELGKVYDYRANYTKFKVLQRERREKMSATAKNQQKEIEHKEKLINKFRAKKNKAKLAQTLIRQLDKMEIVEVEAEDAGAMKMRFMPAPRAGEVVIDIEKMTKCYDEVEVLNDVNFKMIRGERIAFVGQNGQGKTTLSKIIAGKETVSGGKAEQGYNVELAYYAQNQAESLDRNKTVLQTMEDASPPELRTRLRSILGSFLFSGEDVEKKISVLSGGERARVALASLLLRPANLLILDEPTNHLDMISKDVLKKAVLEYDGSLIVVSHDRDFLTGLTDKTLEFKDHKLITHLGDVQEYLTKRQLDSMRELEKKSTVAKPSAAPVNSDASPEKKPERVLSAEEKKHFNRQEQELQKKVKKAENKIEKTEKELKALEVKMAAEDFYGSAGSQDIIDSYDKTKATLQQAMDQWEAEQMEYEDFMAQYT